MQTEEKIREKIEEFFERTCIYEYLFKKGEPSEIEQIKKKTPIGTWKIESVELGYFINSEDQVVVGILDMKDDEIYPIVARILTERAKIIK
ncbi:MAG: hypothetical protein HWN66_02305 [Candidatus Helarchaeota archaeon]|nr:hypothetical protein [Candidatus Helarchaeota archaeon]